MNIDDPMIRRFIDNVIAEDVGLGDITTAAVIPDDVQFQGIISAREDMVVAGLPLAVEVFRCLEPQAEMHVLARDGERMETGAVLIRLKGRAGGLLTAERTALNILQHLSGIATATRRYVDRIEGTGAVLLDTRKTIPGLRLLAKYATRMGGARNHRMGLHDAILIKDNHIAVCGGVFEAVARAKAAGHSPIEVEVENLAQVNEAIAAGADMLLLDNMDVSTLHRAVQLVGDRAKTEASGRVTLESIREVAQTGVDFVSVGRITQSAPAVDIGLDWMTLD
jgi:nicotinate-nucleotide pyrophosphorylase (carboxylating)